jgi:methylated-DNA-[protein]-cysteine S-methyltransferase
LQRIIVHHPIVDVTLFGRLKQGRVKIVAVLFGKKTDYQKEKTIHSNHPSMVRCGRIIREFLDGKRNDLSSMRIDLSQQTEYSKKILLTARKIPYGKTVSYAQLAAMAGKCRSVRAAASVMRNNRFPLVIPCHRVIKSDGSIGGFMGKTRGKEVRLKRLLLTREKS